ncbi:helix-turn-helix domain-containing protein [Terrisporobacter mayombei]|uniref:helix-turn-helix domain-containing protein n=1 Tax=Terrisporobacter mayombei TaxID=1541 RepID=UPI001D15FC3B|nr:helix-turn-helix transcriptional regulator [Terrisporobacter mayombei]
MHDKGISKTKLREMANFSTHTLSKLSKNESVSLYIIDNICLALNCKIEDVVEIKEE